MTLNCFTVQEAKLGWMQSVGGSSFPLMKQSPCLNTISVPTPSSSANLGNNLHSSSESINWEENKRSPRQFWTSLITDWGLVLNRRPSKQQLQRLGPAPKLYWEGCWERRGFCSLGASCAPLMMTIAACPRLIAAQPAVSVPALSPYYPAAGRKPRAGTCHPCTVLLGSQTMSRFSDQGPPAAGDATCN